MEDKESILQRLGEQVRRIRLEKGLTQTELANKINKDHPSINKLENGKVNPSLYFLYEVATGLEVDIKDLI